MRCPNDGATELVAATLDHVAVHDCPACDGVWFGREELRRWLDVDVFAAAEVSSASTAKMCPQCGGVMQMLTYPESDVWIDVCVADHGVWLDKREFDKIVAELDQLTNSMSAADYAHATVEQLKEIFRPHESRWSEIKDFFAVFKLLEIRYGTEHPGVGRAAEILARTGL